MTRCRKRMKALLKMRKVHRMLTRKRLMALVVLTPLVASCAVGPKYFRPNTGVQTIEAYVNASDMIGDQSMARWWERLNDPVVDQLIETAALTNNLKSKMRRVNALFKRVNR